MGDGGLGVAWNTVGNGIRRRSLDAEGGVLAPTGDDGDAVGGCAGVLGGDLAVVETSAGVTALWIDRGWDGPRRILVERMR